MVTRAEPPEPAVDELKRRARRRLVGAIVLALAAAVVLPMLLESDPKPFGDDVAIKIPPIDSGKFINPLSPETPPEKLAPASPAKTSATGVGASNVTGDAPRRPLERSASERSVSSPSSAGPIDASSPSKGSAAGQVAAPPKPAPIVAAPSSDAGSTSGAGFVVQVGAFTDVQAAGDLAAKLKTGGFAAYTEASGGDPRVQRVRIGPFSSHEAADAALAQVKAAGYGSAIVSAR
ncbi:MAG: hypothetical protein E6H66_08065 [Betaproteobacteria bacterium]|nr:MAG: hypothetical protein E6H66_08065 [Betaproteobacteria bacterium]